MFDPKDITYLGNNGDPEPFPREAPSAPQRIIGMGGIRVYESNGTTMVSLDSELFEQLQTGLSQPPTGDPFSEMAFRASLNGSDEILVKAGVISHAYWDVTSWLHDEFEVPEETIDISAITYPALLYLKAPVLYITTPLDSPNGPLNEYDGSATPVDIEGTDYVFSAQTGTNWISLDTTPPASYYTVLNSPPSPDPDFFQLLLAILPSAGSIQVKHFGSVTLPQQYDPSLNSLNVVPA